LSSHSRWDLESVSRSVLARWSSSSRVFFISKSRERRISSLVRAFYLSSKAYLSRSLSLFLILSQASDSLSLSSRSLSDCKTSSSSRYSYIFWRYF
jgi:hypothetical protein